MTPRIVSIVCMAALSLCAATAAAREITLRHDRLVLNAHLELSAGKHIADGVILITHSGLAHGRMDMLSYLQELLKDSGYSSLAITLSLGVDNRHGMFDCQAVHRHRYADGAAEIGAWLDWLKQQGVRKTILLGHSRGAAQTAMYMAGHDNSLVKAVVLLAPDTQATNDAVAYQRRHHTPLAPVLQKAQALVQAGKGQTVLEHTGILYCADTSVTADTIMSYYGPDPRLDTPYLIPGIRKPLLIVIAGNDEVVVGYRDKFAPFVDGQRVQMKVVEGAGHFFRDLYADDAVDAIRVFLKGIGY
jgi:pimeloyl-ACP methyl ester carboxylesterase